MKCYFKNSKFKTAFSLVESVTALVILALVCSSVLVVIDRSVSSAADSAQRLLALEVARKNMETLLSKDSVREMAEFGSAKNHPEIQWQSIVEAFYEPITDRMWIQAVCSAEYTDTKGELQTVELTHWLTDLTKKQLLQIIEEKKKQKEREQSEQDTDDSEPTEPNTPTEPNKPTEPNTPEEPQQTNDEDKICGYTMQELGEMEFAQIWEIFINCDEF